MTSSKKAVAEFESKKMKIEKGDKFQGIKRKGNLMQKALNSKK